MASFARRLVKEKEAGRPLEPNQKMNQLAQEYHDKSRPVYCAKAGYVDEIVAFTELRKYIQPSPGQLKNPVHLPHHQMILPRMIRG